jgi:hypothetical protein
MASLNRLVAVLPADLAGTEDLDWDDARALATARAERRELPVNAETAAAAAAALYGAPTQKRAALPAPAPESEPEVVDAEFDDLEPAPQDMPPPAPEPLAETEAAALARQGAAVAQAKAAEERPYAPARLREQLRKSFAGRAEFVYPEGDRDKKQFAVNKNIEMAFAGEGQEREKRHVVLFFLTGKQSSKELLDGELESLRRWLAVSQNADGEWSPDPLAVAEAKAAYAEGLKEAGQTSF